MLHAGQLQSPLAESQEINSDPGDNYEITVDRVDPVKPQDLFRLRTGISAVFICVEFYHILYESYQFVRFLLHRDEFLVRCHDPSEEFGAELELPVRLQVYVGMVFISIQILGTQHVLLLECYPSVLGVIEKFEILSIIPSLYYPQLDHFIYTLSQHSDTKQVLNILLNSKFRIYLQVQKAF